MQNTRLTQIVTQGGRQLENWLSNSWRQLSLLLLSLLLGYFVGGALAAIAGQAARWDTTVALIILIFTELINRLVYRSQASRTDNRWLPIAMLNNFKMGFIYSLALEALKLGS
ncbi:MAG: DUF565 domain-containing protein [Prochlorothrix sp.]|jgi:uncharacterized membrane protein YoaK (UPF0700 family)